MRLEGDIGCQPLDDLWRKVLHSILDLSHRKYDFKHCKYGT
jgi:hypothetical protein